MKDSVWLRFWRVMTGAPGFILAAAVISWVWYGSFRYNFFVFDDYAGLEHVITGPRAVLLGYNGTIPRVVANSVWWPLYALSGLNPLGYNLYSLALFFLNAVLVYCLLLRLFPDRWTPLVSALFFCASAVGSDAVFWRAANSTLLNVTWYLLTLIAHVKFRRGDGHHYRILSLFLFGLAMLTKEEAASLPFIIILLELLVLEERPDLRTLVRLVAPYCLIVAVYLAGTYLYLYHVLETESELVRLSKFRPLHTMLAPWTVFFLPPNGILKPWLNHAYVTATAIPVTFVLVKSKKSLLFGYLWVFFSFLPQSLSFLSQFEPALIFSSISRHLYLPSIGAALVFGLLLKGVRERLPLPLGHAVQLLVLVLFLYVQYPRVQQRGLEWQLYGQPMKEMLFTLYQMVPTFPENSHVLITRPHEGRAYVQQALRAFYGNPRIYWLNRIEDASSLPTGAHAFAISYDWESLRPPAMYRLK